MQSSRNKPPLSPKRGSASSPLRTETRPAVSATKSPLRAIDKPKDLLRPSVPRLLITPAPDEPTGPPLPLPRKDSFFISDDDNANDDGNLSSSEFSSANSPNAKIKTTNVRMSIKQLLFDNNDLDLVSMDDLNSPKSKSSARSTISSSSASAPLSPKLRKSDPSPRSPSPKANPKTPVAVTNKPPSPSSPSSSSRW
eukprot:CAMPEP_0184346542 /NCGR_PEP_ID=MMETSP1089-20130417/14792_1 /TAXON_ID=38269 ORGANISM="Gloeochaete wittrockiana, Strain SAG46.84" /NCGR_SAMPLE_ID=MMETSP1089 /ASSEMBLY_ACC=CAM_ASM_000445 /LENGTH=195 /DNA_ID=CAMNT_0026677259 /DNA_START=190 /DNA_END=774 /DNA_ORIENTATION=+